MRRSHQSDAGGAHIVVAARQLLTKETYTVSSYAECRRGDGGSADHMLANWLGFTSLSSRS